MITKNDRPVGIMISIEDAAETLIPEMLMAKEAGYDQWLASKVGSTLACVDSGTAILLSHDDAMATLKARIGAKLADRSG